MNLVRYLCFSLLAVQKSYHCSFKPGYLCTQHEMYFCIIILFFIAIAKQDHQMQFVLLFICYNLVMKFATVMLPKSIKEWICNQYI